MLYANDKLGVKFEVADKLTVRKQLAYAAARQFDEAGEAFIAHWRAAVPLLENWTCALVPDPRTLDLDAVTDRQITTIVIWAAGQVVAHMAALDNVPKD